MIPKDKKIKSTLYIVDGRDTPCRRHNVPVTSCSESKYVETKSGQL